MRSSVHFLSAGVVSLSQKTRSHSWRQSETRYPSGVDTSPPYGLPSGSTSFRKRSRDARITPWNTLDSSRMLKR